MTTAVIVQARMESTRLPGKVREMIAGRSALEHVLYRCKAIPNADVVCCAIADTELSKSLVEDARRCDVEVSLGSSDDVVDRYLKAARTLGADVVLRVTSDCPLIDPGVCGDVIELRSRENVDYVANNTPPSWPHGLDCEAFSRAALERAAVQDKRPWAREHVTMFLREDPSVSRANLPGPGGFVAGQRWTLDHPEDLAFFRALFGIFPEAGSADWRQILNVLERHPEIGEINAMYAEQSRNPDALPQHDRARFLNRE